MARQGQNQDPPEVSGPNGPLEGHYANYFQVGFNAVEFLLDFGQHFAGPNGVRLQRRIVTGPIYAKVFLKILAKSVKRYEKLYGVIPEQEP